MSNIAIKIENVSKEYCLGAIGGTTLRDEMHRLADKVFHRMPVNADYGKKFMALQNINLEVKKGERLGIIGHNGAGKSTLLKLLSRVTAPTTGSISYNGRISSMLEVGTGFHGELTGRENIYMNGAILGMTKREIDSKIDQIIDFAEMQQFIDTPVKRYSSGMYVKLAFAVAAHLDNEILIMDEVLAVGDMKFQQKCLGKMGDASAQDGKTILYVSHNMNTVRQLCERCVVMEHGKIIFDGNVDDAVDIYMGSISSEKSNHVELGRRQRPSYSTNKFQMQSVDVENKNCIVKADESELALTLNVLVAEKAQNMFVRFFIFDCARRIYVAITTAYIERIDYVGINHFRFKLDLTHLFPGVYSLRVLFSTGNMLSQLVYDDLEEVCRFERIYDLANINVNYKKNQHGYFNLGEATVETVQ
ncbi:MAG: Teichoic acids export ATP-binding protein TagH [Lentisphaerae bacterium ADurb.Bin082]|nr:MAG: Teichoic acids export ATP-binding protein TagH [Lentisphaerae bacterium ADurb.Bin082]